MTQITLPDDQAHATTQISIACYQPKTGKEEALKELVKKHVPALLNEQLVTDCKAIITEAKNRTIIEIFEWRSDEAIHKAHSITNVMELWKHFGELCDYVVPGTLEECKHIFSGFRPVN